MPQYFHHASLIFQSAISLLLFIQPTRPHSRPYIRVMPFDWQVGSHMTKCGRILQLLLLLRPAGHFGMTLKSE